MPLPSVFQGVQDCRLPALTPPKTLPTLPQASASNPPNASAGLQGNNSYSYMSLPSVFQGVQDCRLPALKPPKRFQRSRRPPRQQLLQLHVPAICFSGRSRLPFARPQTVQTLPKASKATTLTATSCPCHLFFRGFKAAVCPPSNPPNPSNASAGLQGNNSYSYYMPLPSVFSGGSRLPFARPQTPQTLPTLPQASKATTLTATTCPCHLFFRGFKTAVCPPSNPPNPSNASAGLQGNNSYSYYMPLPSVFRGVQDCRLPALKPPKRFQRSRRPPSASNAPAGLQGNNSYSYMPLPSLFQGVQNCRLPALKTPKPFQRSRRPPPQTLQTLPQASKATTLTATTCPCHLFFQRVQGCRLPALKPPKPFQRFRRPPRQQLLQLLHAPAICFSGGSRLPFARPQTPQTFQRSRGPPRQQLLQLHARAICFFRASAGLQGNNSYSYMPLPSLFQGVQDCRLPALKPPKPFQRFRRPPRQQLLQLLHAPALCPKEGGVGGTRALAHSIKVMFETTNQLSILNNLLVVSNMTFIFHNAIIYGIIIHSHFKFPEVLFANPRIRSRFLVPPIYLKRPSRAPWDIMGHWSTRGRQGPRKK